MGRFPIIVYISCFVFVYGQTTQKVCWDSKWYNDSGVLRNRSSFEHQSVKVLDTICSNGPVTAAQCKDDKGEPFNVAINSTANHYYVVCNHVIGLICHPYNNSINATCPDFAIQYGCNCPTKATRGVSTMSAQGMSVYTNSGGVNTGSQSTGSGAGSSASGQQNGHCRNNGQHYGASHLVLLLCAMTLKVLF
ncbi:uncharacterized protein LOC128554761 [Mercenaria mercenaria]|uniref:uncharacterized protein LOC128554761 n=1 Tax=Mercenaria mercenaria TaxID=6596 RepID=UPI00234E6A6B|nr:uncharacterized protein LOC128554761 [Mercenaria mercenaria]